MNSIEKMIQLIKDKLGNEDVTVWYYGHDGLMIFNSSNECMDLRYNVCYFDEEEAELMVKAFNEDVAAGYRENNDPSIMR